MAYDSAMPKRLDSKTCPYCGIKIFGTRRRDRKSFYYSPRCKSCARKALDPEVIATKRRVINAIRRVSPIGATRLHNSGRGCIYIEEKTEHGWDYQHRIRVGAQPGEHVHHYDGHGLNNSPANLVRVTPKEHARHHGLNGLWAVKFSECRECKSVRRPHIGHGLCDCCYQRDTAKTKGHWPKRIA